MKKLTILFLVLIAFIIQAQEKNKYGLLIINNYKYYLEGVAKDGDYGLVDLQKFIPSLKIDIRYATTNNFTGKKLYNKPAAYLRYAAAIQLKKAQEKLAKEGLGIKIYDAYRPYSVTEDMWEYVKDDRYAADPRKGSRHNRGCAVDLTLVTLSTGAELEMPTPYDDFTNKAHHAYMDLPEKILKNRARLRTVMEECGFESITSEWWHYDFKGWERFPLMDIQFEQLEQ